MTLKQLRNGLIIRGVIYLVVLGVASQVFFFLTRSEEELQQKYSWLKNDINSLNSKLQNLNKKTLEFAEIVKVWEGMSESQKSLQGLRSRINQAKDLIDALEKDYSLQTTTSFSKPKELGDEFATGTTVVVSSDVNISVKAYSDADIFNFVHALTNDFPGYVQVRTFKIKRDNQVSKPVLRQIAAGKDSYLVDAEVAFVWYDLKEIVQEEEQEETQGGAS